MERARERVNIPMNEAKLPGKRITIILSSSEYQRVSNALSIALAALSVGLEAYILLTFDSLNRFRKGHLNDMGEETPQRLQPAIQSGICGGPIQPLDEQLAVAREMGLKIYACPNAMATFKIARRELVEVDEVMGLISFMGIVDGAAANWYI